MNETPISRTHGRRECPIYSAQGTGAYRPTLGTSLCIVKNVNRVALEEGDIVSKNKYNYTCTNDLFCTIIRARFVRQLVPREFINGHFIMSSNFGGNR